MAKPSVVADETFGTPVRMTLTLYDARHHEYGVETDLVSLRGDRVWKGSVHTIIDRVFYPIVTRIKNSLAEQE